MRKLYAVSSGWYSDYGILAIFELEETARAWVSARLLGQREERIALCERELERSAAIRRGELVGEFSWRTDSKIRDEIERLRDGSFVYPDPDEFRVEEFDYYEGQELPAPGLVTTE